MNLGFFFKLRVEFIILNVFKNSDLINVNEIPEGLDKYLERWNRHKKGLLEMRKIADRERENLNRTIIKCSLVDQDKIRSIVDKNILN